MLEAESAGGDAEDLRSASAVTELGDLIARSAATAVAGGRALWVGVTLLAAVAAWPRAD